MTQKIKDALQRFRMVPMTYDAENMRSCQEAIKELGRLENLLERLRNMPHRILHKMLEKYDAGQS